MSFHRRSRCCRGSFPEQVECATEPSWAYEGPSPPANSPVIPASVSTVRTCPVAVRRAPGS